MSRQYASKNSRQPSWSCQSRRRESKLCRVGRSVSLFGSAIMWCPDKSKPPEAGIFQEKHVQPLSPSLPGFGLAGSTATAQANLFFARMMSKSALSADLTTYDQQSQVGRAPWTLRIGRK